MDTKYVYCVYCVYIYMIISQNNGTPIWTPKYYIVLIIGTSKNVPLILGNPHIYNGYTHSLDHDEDPTSHFFLIFSMHCAACAAADATAPSASLQWAVCTVLGPCDVGV